MRLGRRWLVAVIGLWGLLLVLLARHPAPSGCPAGSCPACGACLPPAAPPAAGEVTRVA